jgi:phosphohistidine phosphatase SixA
VTTTDIRFLLMRHGRTSMTDKPEGWRAVRLSATGRIDAQDGGNFLAANLDRLPPISHLISSPLPRSRQTADIVGGILGINNVDSDWPELRAFDIARETPGRYARRSEQALQRLLSVPGMPLVIAHRSTTSWLGQRYSLTRAGDDKSFVKSLIDTGGVMAVGDISEGSSGLAPLWRPLEANWPGSTGTPVDLADEPLPDRAEVDDNPDAKFRALRRFATMPLEHRGGRRDLTPIDGYTESWMR